jgi:hypothetical protein
MRENLQFKTNKIFVFVIFLVALGIVAVAPSRPVSASVLWFDTAIDSDSDFSVGYYADISELIMGTLINDPDNLYILMEPYWETWDAFFVTGNGALSFDTNLDGLDDFIAYAPNAQLSANRVSPRQMQNGAGSLINCFSQWSMTSDYRQYAISIPWRCMGMPSQFSVEAWMSNSFGFDFLNFNYQTGAVYYPVFSPQTTTTVPIVVPAPAITAPTSVSYRTANKGVTLRWSPVVGASSYVVTTTRGTQVCATTIETSCLVDRLRNGRAYSYNVFAVNADGVRSVNSTSVSVRPGFQVKKTTVKTRKNVSLSSIVTTPSKGKKTWTVTSGACRISKARLVTPSKSGSCKLRLNTAKSGSYPAMSTTITVSVG